MFLSALNPGLAKKLDGKPGLIRDGAVFTFGMASFQKENFGQCRDRDGLLSTVVLGQEDIFGDLLALPKMHRCLFSAFETICTAKEKDSRNLTCPLMYGN